ncbi:hypothetical protein AAC387_Pa04g2666 [Persea americana]
MSVCKLHRGEIGLVFEHPTVPGNQSGGWMARQKQKQLESDQLKKSMSTPFLNTSSHQLPMSKVKKHKSPDSAWIIIHGDVYDCTKFLTDHPGGTDSILINAGSDCTEEFDAIHSDKAKAMLEQYRIAELITSSSSPSSAEIASTINQSASAASALTPGKKIPCKLISKTSISHNVCLFHFALPSPDLVLGLPVGKHVFLCAVIDGKLCMRAYTPTSAVDEVGHFDLLVEIYFKGIHPKFPNGGLMTQHSSTIEVKGPVSHSEYNGQGHFTIHGKPKLQGPWIQRARTFHRPWQTQVGKEACHDRRWKWNHSYLSGDAGNPERPKRQNRNREGWEYSTGRITERMLKEHIPEGSTDTLALLCGPPAMIHSTVLPNLEKMGYDIKNSCLTF